MKGWTPTNDIESVVVQIRAQMVVGRARIDFDSPTVTQVKCMHNVCTSFYTLASVEWYRMACGMKPMFHDSISLSKHIASLSSQSP